MAKSFPTAEDLLGFLSSLDGKPSSRRDICKYFAIKGDDRRKLRRLITSLRMEGFIASGNRNNIQLSEIVEDKTKIQPKDELPIIDVMVTNVDSDGELFCKPVDSDLLGVYPSIILDAKANVIEGDVVTVRLTETIPGEFMGHVLEQKKSQKDEKAPQILGIYNSSEQTFKAFARALSKVQFKVMQPPADTPDGAVIRVQPLIRKDGVTPVKLMEVVAKSPLGLESVIAMRNHNIPDEFRVPMTTEERSPIYYQIVILECETCVVL